jgi:uncharacterized protein
MKEGVRIMAVSCAPLDREKTRVVGVISRKGYIEGILSAYVTVDGTDSAVVIAKMLKNSRFWDQVRLIAVNGIGVAGLNILDVEGVERATHTKVLSITRGKPHPAELINALKTYSKLGGADVSNRVKLVEKMKDLNEFRLEGLYSQTSLDRADAKRFARDAFELLRVAHLIASGVSKGESKGRI